MILTVYSTPRQKGLFTFVKGSSGRAEVEPTFKNMGLKRFASLAWQNVLGLRIQLTPIDFDGTIRIRGSIDGNPEDNDGFNPWLILDQDYSEASSCLLVRTRTSRIELGMAFKLVISGTKPRFRDISVPGFPTVESRFDVVRGVTVTVEKLVTVFTSRVDNYKANLQKDASLADLDKNNSFVNFEKFNQPLAIPKEKPENGIPQETTTPKPQVDDSTKQ